MEIGKAEKILEIEKMKLINLLPSDLRVNFYQHSYIGGGAIYCLVNDKEVKDYDFFLDDQSVVDELREHFEKNSTLMYKGDIKIGTYQGYRLIVTANAISIGDYQIITRWIGTPTEVIGDFDFCHNMFYFRSGKIHNLTSWSNLYTKELKFNDERARDIANCIVRMNKFLKRDFTIDNKEIAKILLKLNDVGFSAIDIEILESKNENRLRFGSGD